jgi:ribonuclease P protein component
LRTAAARGASASPSASTRSSPLVSEAPPPARATFDRSRRVRRRRDFQRIQAGGFRVKTRHFVLLVSCQEGATSPDAASPLPARLGVVASRRVGDAVVRNRVKRLCRECFRRSPDLLPAGVDLVVIAREGADSLKLQGVMAEWRHVVGPLRRGALEALARPAGATHVSAAVPARTRHDRP